jgi:curved DNA-binding protein CbpA
MHNANRSVPARSRYLSLYGKLGVSPNASPQSIHAAYEVLKSAYCPGGAYIDDAMHEAFSEIRNAAKILCNPKTRRLYDLGYIDEAGRQTGAGRAHAVRLRTAWMSSAAVFAVLAIVLSSLWISPKEAPGGAQVAGPAARVNAAAPKEATAPKAEATPLKAIEDAAPAPAQQVKHGQNREATARKPAPIPGQEFTPFQPRTQTDPPPETAFQRREAPATVSRPRREARAKRVPQNNFAPETKRRRYANRPDPRGRGTFAWDEPSSFWEGEIWFPRRRAYYGR